MNKKRKQYIESCEVSLTAQVQLGGYRQTIALEGRKKSLPIVLFLHGGPGCPIPFSVGCRGLFPQFTDHFLMVYWDQLGCGINNYHIDNHFEIRDFVTMTCDLVHYLKKQYPDNRLYLFGVSWGSILALKTVETDSKNIDGVFTYGQVVAAPMFSEDAFEAVEQSNAPEKEKKFVRNLRLNVKTSSSKEKMRLSEIIRKYTDGYMNHHSKQASTKSVIKGMLTSPDYRFKDFFAVIKNGYRKNESLIQELSDIDLEQIFAKIPIPYYIFQGNTDIVTSTNIIQKTIQNRKNPNVYLQVIENAGHIPSEYAIEQILDFMIKLCNESMEK